MYSITIWTEGGADIGMGHVVRSANLARLIMEGGIFVEFWVNDSPAVASYLEEFELRVHPLDAKRHVPATDLVILDTKKDVTELVKMLKRKGKKVMLIDNTTDAKKYADVAVIPSLFCKPFREKNVYTGKDFIILGESFRKARERRHLEYSHPLKILVSMGGADPNNLTLKVVKALWNVKDIDVIVVIGPAYRHVDSLARYESELRMGFNFIYGVKDIAPLTTLCHVGITAMGTTVNEFAYVGMPSIIIGNYPDDAEDMYTFNELNIGTALGYHMDVEAEHIREAVEHLVDDERLWRAYSTNARALIDGNGGLRVLKLINMMMEKNEAGFQATGSA